MGGRHEVDVWMTRLAVSQVHGLKEERASDDSDEVEMLELAACTRSDV